MFFIIFWNNDSKNDDRYNKNDNIHKSEALKLLDKQTLTLEECQNLIVRI